MIAKADEAEVEKFAPRTLQAAKRYLNDAEQEINRNRYDMTVPQNLAEQATLRSSAFACISRDLIQNDAQERR